MPKGPRGEQRPCAGPRQRQYYIEYLDGVNGQRLHQILLVAEDKSDAEAHAQIHLQRAQTEFGACVYRVWRIKKQKVVAEGPKEIVDA